MLNGNGEMQERPEEKPAVVVGVRFRQAGKIYDFDAGSLILKVGDKVVVDTERGYSLGVVAMAPRQATLPEGSQPLRKVVKKADLADQHKEEMNKRKEAEAYRVCLDHIHRRRLPMKLVEVEYLFDGSKAIFYFCAEHRVDFRDLVRDLAQALHTRIEMKQIGARDETKMVGGLGPCGQILCCCLWLREFQAVSVRMAKDQGLSLNPGKLAGQCGRLKCCLRYENETYCALKQVLPKVGTRVTTPKGPGEVVRQNILARRVWVRLPEAAIEVEFGLDDLRDWKPCRPRQVGE